MPICACTDAAVAAGPRDAGRRQRRGVAASLLPHPHLQQRPSRPARVSNSVVVALMSLQQRGCCNHVVRRAALGRRRPLTTPNELLYVLICESGFACGSVAESSESRGNTDSHVSSGRMPTRQVIARLFSETKVTSRPGAAWNRTRQKPCFISEAFDRVGPSRAGFVDQ